MLRCNTGANTGQLQGVGLRPGPWGGLRGWQGCCEWALQLRVEPSTETVHSQPALSSPPPARG